MLMERYGSSEAWGFRRDKHGEGSSQGRLPGGGVRNLPLQDLLGRS